MARRKTGTAGGSTRTTGAGCLIWLMMLLVTLLLFVLNWDRIQDTLETTGFAEAVGSAKTGAPAASEKPEADPGTGDGSLAPAAEPAKPEPKPEPEPEPKPEPAPKETAKPASGATDPATTTARPSPAREAPKASPPPAATPMEQLKSTRVAALYLIRVDDDGTVSRHEVKRTVAASDSPMTDALEALMAGPNTDELNRGFISFIPSEARLLSAQVRGSTAYLNFNEAFMFNRYGIEGYAGQLKQIVYTATGFPNVKDVQVLIEGQKRDYLGGDGVYIGKPLSRASF